MKTVLIDARRHASCLGLCSARASALRRTFQKTMGFPRLCWVTLVLPVLPTSSSVPRSQLRASLGSELPRDPSSGSKDSEIRAQGPNEQPRGSLQPTSSFFAAAAPPGRVDSCVAACRRIRGAHGGWRVACQGQHTTTNAAKPAVSKRHRQECRSHG